MLRSKKNLLVAALFIAVMLATFVGPVPQKAYAADPAVLFSSVDLNCDDIYYTNGTIGWANIEIYVPEGFTVHEQLIDVWGDYWTSQAGQQVWGFDNEFVAQQAFTISRTWGWLVDVDGGDVTHILELYAPDGTMVAASTVHLSCDNVSVHSGSIFNPMPPDPASRVMGTVVAESPLYSVPSLDHPIADTLVTVDQTWFVVDTMTTDDGMKWYEVFVGGWNNAWLPSTAIQTPEDITGGYEQAKPDVPTVSAPTAPKTATKQANGGFF